MEKRMLEYLPPVLQEVRDFQCLMEVYQGEVSALWWEERETEDNFYLFTADGRGLSHWENILGISPREGSSLEERRLMIFARRGQTTPYCWQMFLTFLTALTGTREAFRAELSGFALELRLMPNWRWMQNAVRDLMWRVLPANIGVQLISVYNTHGDLGRWRHGEMRAFTHEGLRSKIESEVEEAWEGQSILG